MSRKIVLWSTLVLVLAGLGCGGDQRETLIVNTATRIDEAATAMEQLRSAINKGVKEATDKKRPLKAEDLEEAMQFTDKLKKAAEAMLKIKQESDGLKDVLSKEEKDQLQEKHGEKIKSALKRLETEQNEVNKVLANVKKMEMQAKALDRLEKSFKEAQGGFAALAKQR